MPTTIEDIEKLISKERKVMPPAYVWKPIRPLFHLYGWNGLDLKWASLHGQGPLAMKWGMVHGAYGVPYASSFVDATREKILIPNDWRETWSSIDREMFRVTLLTREYATYRVVEVSYLELAEYLRAIDSEKWLKEWDRPDRAFWWGLTVDDFKKEMHDLWRSEWGDIPAPA